jgi:prepilin-type N-terminal cleavage/methylation domain-containing protein/prepilin-type processing-associated H-X9-DG protein
MSPRPRRHAFTLVELLVVIGIIALLIAILLPALNRARESAQTIKCASNLRAVGQAFATYGANNHGVLPASNYYQQLAIVNDPTTGLPTQTPATPIAGYVHWSALIFGGHDGVYAQGFASEGGQFDPIFYSTAGWSIFTCPSLDKGGLPPANTFAGNNDGLANEAGANVVDQQSPRLAYTINEALAPRSRLVAGFSGAVTPQHFVVASRVRNSQSTILATEMWGSQSLNTTTSQVGGGTVSNSRRPVSGLSAALSGIASADKAYTVASVSQLQWATTADMTPDPSMNPPVPSKVNCSLDFVGRNHGGSRRLGVVNGPNGPIGGWDMRTSNFLYLDGHAETKNVADTIYPQSQWGDQFYSEAP